MLEIIPEIEDIYVEYGDEMTGDHVVTVTREEIEQKVCNCSDCKEIIKCHETCEFYIDKLIAAFPVGEPFMSDRGYMAYPVMGGYVPKDLVDRYTDNLYKRLKEVNLKENIPKYKKDRPIYWIDELEDERRMLHIAILYNAGFTPLEIGVEAVAFKIVIEKFIERRLHTLGVI